jgi:signal transduction histidine kinase
VSRWRQAFDRIGGPDAVTWPAFWITFFTSLVGNITTGGAVSAPLVVRVLVIVVVQLAMFAPLVLLRYTLLRNPPRPRPWVAILGFVAAAVIRGLCLSGILLAIGAVDEPLWTYRIVASLINTGGLLVIVAILVSAMRAHTRSLEQLMIVDRELTGAQDQILAEVTDRNEEALARVKSRLADEMVALDSLQGERSVIELQRLASEVVRPMSHELAATVPAGEVPDLDIDGVHVTSRQVVTQMITGAPFRPSLNAAVFAIMMLTSALGVFGALGIPLMAVIVASVLAWSWLANRLLAVLLPRLSPRGGLTVVLISALVIGYLSSATGAWVLRSTDDARPVFIGGGLFIAVVILLLALVTAVLRQQGMTESELADRVERLRWAIVRLRQVQWLQGKALSRALHGPVQAAVTSAALRLDAAVRAGEATEALLEEIRTDLRTTIDVLDAPEAATASLNEALARIIGTWDGICAVSADVDPRVRECLDADPVAGSTVVDLLTEAVSNSVRHGAATGVEIRVVQDGPDAIRLTVRDDGSVASASPREGLGTSLLEECTLWWSRTVVSQGQVLEALLPCPATPDLVGETGPR